MSQYWQGKRVLVTGAGGFIGSHLAERLVSEGAIVRAFVRYNSRSDAGLLSFAPKNIIERMQIVAGDLRDSDAIHKAVDGCQVVFHLGALISIPYSYLHPLEVAETNLLGTINVLMACERLRVERLIHTSTSEVYGTAQRVPIDEGHPLQGQSPYSASKIGADKLAESFHCAYSLPVVTVRPFNTFGPRQSARAVIPTIITQALSQSIISLGNLETTRDFTYVDDTVDGFIKAGEAPDVDGKILNLGTGSEIKIGALVEKIVRLTGSSAQIEVDPVRLRPAGSEVLRLVSNNALARAVLGWTPRISLDAGLKQTIDWIKEHLNCYRVGFYEF
jgi:dTDP-glucose 4,6-dehydratase